MKKSLLNTTIIIALLFTLSACCTVVPGKVIYSKDFKETVEKTGAKALLLITADGEVLVYNELGNQDGVNECEYPKPHDPVEKKDITQGDQIKISRDSHEVTSQQVASPPNYPDNVCKGLRIGSAITNIQTISILRSNSDGCLIIGKDQEGNPIQVCWPR